MEQDKDHKPAFNKINLENKNLFKALDQYFEWLFYREESEHDMGNVQARDAVADCSSQLGLILIENGVFVEEVDAKYGDN